jgi:T5SS/PEP-CTERM-associated repeat protein
MRKSIAGNLVLSVLGGIVFMAGTAGAATSYWGSASGNYTNAASWQSGGVPQAADSVFFVNDAAYTATFTSDWMNDTASFEGPTQLVTLDIGTGHTWSLASEFHVGYDGAVGRAEIVSGTLDVTGEVNLGYGSTEGGGSTNNLLVVTNGAVVHSGNLTLGQNGYEAADANNLLHISGPGSAWYVERGFFYVGAYKVPRGNTVKVSDGGYLAVRDNSANVGAGYAGSTNNALIVEGAGSQFEFVALTGNKTFGARQDNRIVIRDGGNVTLRYEGGTTRNTYFGPKEHFQLFIESGGSFTNVGSSQSTPNFNNASRCEISGGGAFYSVPFTYFKDDSQLIVTGPGSKVTSVNGIYFEGNAYFEVSGGASNLSARNYIGNAAGSNARMLLTGANSYSMGELNIAAGCGRITIADGAFFAAGRIQTASSVGSTGIVEVTGTDSRLTSTHATINQIGMLGICSLTVTNGGTFQAPSLNIGLNASAAGSELSLYDGTITCAGTVSANYGKVSIRGTGGTFAPGTLVLTNTTSELEFIAAASGFTQIQPGTLTIASGAKLTVDAQAWLVDSEVVTNLVAYTSMPTTFSAGDVSVTVADGYTGSIDQGDGSNDAIALTLTPPPRGTVISVR